MRTKRSDLGSLAFEHGKIAGAKCLWRMHSTRSHVITNKKRTTNFVDWFVSESAMWAHAKWILDHDGDVVSVTAYKRDSQMEVAAVFRAAKKGE